MSSAPLLHKLNWLPVKQLLYLRDSNMAEKCFKQSRSNLFMQQILQTFNHPQLGKHDTLKMLLKFKTATDQRTFIYSAGNI